MRQTIRANYFKSTGYVFFDKFSIINIKRLRKFLPEYNELGCRLSNRRYLRRGVVSHCRRHDVGSCIGGNADAAFAIPLAAAACALPEMIRASWKSRDSTRRDTPGQVLAVRS